MDKRPSESCDPYVYKTRSRWTWNCPCGALGGIYASRMHADTSAETHFEASRKGSYQTGGDQ